MHAHQIIGLGMVMVIYNHCARCKVMAEPPREVAINREKARSR